VSARGLLRRRLTRLRPRLLPLIRASERAAFGGPRRGSALAHLQLAHVRSVNRRTWSHVDVGEEPPFYDHRIGGVLFALAGENPYGWQRGFHAVELIRPGDAVLDVGCGDGFFASRFFAPIAGRVDAVDIERSAIRHARTHNETANVRFIELDAVRAPFPEPPYDLIVWDGAIGHFAAEDTDTVLAKIAAALAPGGAFVGSETLGTSEGADHLQWFSTLEDLGRVLARHFPHTEIKAARYPTQREALQREEGYWRCALERTRLDAARWRSVTAA